MKQAIVIICLFTGIALSSTAQKLDASKVPPVVKAEFARQYPGVVAKWEKEKGQFEAGFTQHGKAMSALYKPDGTRTESEVDIAITELPPAVVTYVKTHYKGAAIKESAKITATDGTVTYEAEVNKMDVLFDASGKFIKEVKD